MKKYSTTVSFAKITVIVFMLFTTFANAQTGLPDAPDDTAAPAPIGDHIWILALLGMVFVFLTFRAIQNKKIKG